jgi:hypothetical protein
MMITERQKIELSNFNKKQCEAVIAFGADLYRQGLVKGTIIGIVGFGIGMIISYIVNEIKSSRK